MENIQELYQEDPLCLNYDCNIGRKNLSSEEDHYLVVSTNNIFGIAAAVLMPLVIIGNSLVIITLFRFARFRTTTNLLIGSLSMADLVLGCVTLPLYISFYFYGDVLKEIKYVCLLKYSFALGTMSASLCSLVSISYDRFIAITRPLSYRVRMTKKKATYIIIGIWCYHFVVSLLPILGWNYYNENLNNVTHTHKCNFFVILPVPYTVFTTPFVILVALFISAYFYIRIYRETVNHNKRQFLRRSTSSDRLFGLRQFKKDTKSAKMMALVSVLFFIFWIPFMVGCILKYAWMTKDMSEVIKNICLTLTMSNSAVNPCIYCWMRKDFRAAFLVIICCKKGSDFKKITSLKQKCGRKEIYCDGLVHNKRLIPFTVDKALANILRTESGSSYGDVSDDGTPNSVFSEGKTFPYTSHSPNSPKADEPLTVTTKL